MNWILRKVAAAIGLSITTRHYGFCGLIWTHLNSHAHYIWLINIQWSDIRNTTHLKLRTHTEREPYHVLHGKVHSAGYARDKIFRIHSFERSDKRVRIQYPRCRFQRRPCHIMIKSRIPPQTDNVWWRARARRVRWWLLWTRASVNSFPNSPRCIPETKC